MGIVITGLTSSPCPACKRSLLGGMVYSAREGQEVKCPRCGQWAVFSFKGEWEPIPWDRHPPAHGDVTENDQAWQSAVAEIEALEVL